MIRLGVDFGTTNTVVAIQDRGMFSTVHHRAQTATGTVIQETFPSVILFDRSQEKFYFGIEAERRFYENPYSEDLLYFPSLKRHLCHYSEGGKISIRLDKKKKDQAGTFTFDLADVLRQYLTALANSIRQSQSLENSQTLEAVITWPANANGAQRYITRKCFREAGFQIISTLNEPTASAIELADFYLGMGKSSEKKSSAIAVFDMGGGTFDASVVWISGENFKVLASNGIENLGGDDFDQVLYDMFLEQLKVSPEEISLVTQQALLRHARIQKELISSGTISNLHLIPREFGFKGRTIAISVKKYRERIIPMLKRSIEILKHVIKSAKTAQSELNKCPMTIYLVGGSSKLPFTSELVSEAFPEMQVIIADKPFQSVAMGAAISSIERITYQDIFARHFGLFRLKDSGQTETFDIIFPAGTPIPRRNNPPLKKVRWYNPAHNIGHSRYLECNTVDENGLPSDGQRLWSDILFPYDPALPKSTSSLTKQDVKVSDRFSDLSVCEIYRCDADGVITVELQNPARNESNCYELYKE